MTVIVGLVDNGTVYLGADSSGSNEVHIASRVDPKVFRTGEYVIGYTSSFRMGQLIKYSLKLPEPPAVGDLMAFMATDFINSIRTCLKGGGWTEVEKNREAGGNFLVGVTGRLFEIESDFQVNEELQQYGACGSGSQLALGSLHTSLNRGFGPRSRLQLALDAAEFFSPKVRGPFHYVTLPGRKHENAPEEHADLSYSVG